MNRFSSLRFFLLLLLPGFSLASSPIQDRADWFLKLANAGYQALYRVNSEAQWLAVTDVTPEHDAAAVAAGKAYAAFNGNPAIITEARDLLTHEKELHELTVRQLKQLLLNAAEGPMTNPDLVSKRVEAETKQASILNSFEFKLNGQKITANEIDNKLEKSTDLAERKAVWECSKESGPALKPNLLVLRDLRNGVAKEMTYPDYFSLEVASYEIQAGREISSAGAEEDSGALDQQSLESGMARPGRSGQHRQIFRRSKTGMDHQDGRAVLHRSRILTVAGKFLEKIRFVSCAARRQAEEKYACLMLACRS